MRLLRIRFRLLSLLVAVSLCSTWLAWAANRQHRLWRQERAFNEITEHGGYVSLYHEGAYVYFQAADRPWCGTGRIRDYQPQTATVSFADPQLPLLHEIIQPFHIKLTGTKVTPTGKDRIRQELPNCTIED